MAGKSRRKKGKYSIQSKKQSGSVRPNPVVQQPLAAKVNETTPIASVPAPSRVVPARPARGAAQMAKPMTVRNAFVATELRTIGILAGLMLILLVVLARVLA
jgi:hypothetical protein